MFGQIGNFGGNQQAGGMRGLMRQRRRHRMMEQVQGNQTNTTGGQCGCSGQDYAGISSDQGYSPTQGLFGGMRAQNAGQHPGAGLSQEQRSEIRQDIQAAHSDGQVTKDERRAIKQKIRSFKQESGQSFPPPPPPFAQNGGFGGGIGQLMSSFSGGGY